MTSEFSEFSEKPGEKFSELTFEATELLRNYRSVWEQKLAELANSISHEKYRELFETVYLHLNLPAPLVVSVDSPFQLMLMPALLRIRALCDEGTWQMISEQLTFPLWKKTVDALQQNVSDDEILTLLGKRVAQAEIGTSPDDVDNFDIVSRMHSVDSIFARPKGRSVDPRLGFFEAFISQLDLELNETVTSQIRHWIGAECTWSDTDVVGQMEEGRVDAMELETSRLRQLWLAIQNLTNMGTTERAAMRILRERGEMTSIIQPEMVKQGELESQLFDQLGETMVNLLAQALSAQNLEPTIYENYPPAMEAIFDGSTTGLWFTGQLAVGFNSIIMHPRLERLPMFTFLIDMNVDGIYSDTTKNAIENMRLFLANKTPICPFSEILFVCKPPTMTEVNEEGRLHSTDGPALSYADGFSVYSIDGVTVSEKTAVSPEQLTVEEIEGEVNLEVRRVMLERFGIGRYLVDSQAEILNQDEYGTLYRKRVAGDEPIVMVRVINSTPEPDGSFREYFLRVPPFMETAKEAVAWTFNFAEEEYQPEIES